MLRHHLFLRKSALMFAATGAVLWLMATPALAAPPAAPIVTTSADIKQLQFDWDIVPRSNYYELWFKANNLAPYVKFSESVPWRPRILSSVSAHLLDWDQARYQVRACNFSGCSASAPIAVADQMAETIGYFKADRLHNNGRFGIATAISEDGNTLAAFTAGETAPDFPKAAVYVFAKINGRWRQQARLIPESSVAPYRNDGLHVNYEPSLSLSADGNVLVAAMAFREDTNGADSGAVTIYRRSVGQWTEEHQVIQTQFFASYVGLLFAEVDNAGERILFRPGTNEPAELIVHASDGWHRQPIPNPFRDQLNGHFCTTTRLSGDGTAIAWGCSELLASRRVLFTSRAPGWQLSGPTPLPFPERDFIGRVAIDHSGQTVAVSSAISGTSTRSQVRVFRAGATPGAWEISAPIYAGDWDQVDIWNFGRDLALSHDGKLLAVLHPRDSGAGTGALTPPLQPGTQPTGATYIYELRPQGPFLRRVLKPNNPIPAGGIFDGQVRFANNGKTLVVSEPDEPGNSAGVDGDRFLGGRPRTGAVWLY